MASDPLSRQRAQLDAEERDRLEGVVAEMRERVEDDVAFRLARRGLDERPKTPDDLDDDTRRLVAAIDGEGADGHDWNEAFEQYVAGVGYTVVTRLAALRCMEVRGFLDEAVTVFGDDGLTPAAETLAREGGAPADEAAIRAYHDACDRLADEAGIVFDRETAYSRVDPDDDTFEDLCGLLDGIPDAVWRADDVLGWVYEYYNRPAVEALDAKNTLEPDDVGPANQFYTPHWVVRMLTDNSLGKLYLEATGRESAVPDPEERSPAERKERPATSEAAPDVPELCTYLIPDADADAGEAPSFDHPRELRVLDPACGSGHFLLYAFDVLERIWWAETDLDRGEIPARILEHNLYGVDIDLRSCRLAAFNLYLKARTRANAEDAEFEMPNLGIVCADARVADVEGAADVLDRIAGERTDVREALTRIVEEFRTTEALGSLLDVRGTLAGEFVEECPDTPEQGRTGPHTLDQFLDRLAGAVEERTADSFGERNLRSFPNLLVVLTQEYDVALMNPPYGSGGRMPDDVKAYVEDHYEYATDYYINFFEACDRLVATNGRIGMLVPRSFMFLQSFRRFREDFVGGRGSFDFLAEYGIGILDNATVRTAGTVVRSGGEGGREGTFFRLGDVERGAKERAFLHAAFVDDVDDGVRRRYERDLGAFDLIPGTPLSYWVPRELRETYSANCYLDADTGGVGGESLGTVSAGLCTGDDDRFVRRFWEVSGEGEWVPFAKGGSDAWLLPRVDRMVDWSPREMASQPGGRVQNTDDYFSEALSYTVAKESGRRFGYLHPTSIFSHKGSVLIPDRAVWQALSYTNSHLFTYLMLAQTTERMWEVGLVATVPWAEDLETIDRLETLPREAVGHLVSKRRYDPVSPHYDGPVLLDVLGIDESLPRSDHPHRDLRERVEIDTPAGTVPPSASLTEIGVAAARHLERVEANLQSCADAIDEAVFDCFDVTGDQRETVLQEIALRTNGNPRERETYDPDAITDPGDDFPGMVKDLLLHLAIRVVREDDDGIVPLSAVDGEDDLLARIEDEFERLFGGHAPARLANVDGVLGDEPADGEAYPNLRAWLTHDLFDYHVSRFDRRPICWQLTTERLAPDHDDVGFACLVDYHQLDANVVDRLRDRYLEPRKALLRERRSAADRRRSDDALPTADRMAAAEAYARCENGLEGIGAFEDRLADLAEPAPREWPAANRERAAAAAGKVVEFRDRTAARLETLDALADLDDVDVDGLFSPSFYETVEENRGEWLDALDALEAAFEAYAGDGSEPVAAGLYDLFEYYDELIGSPHHASNGILVTTYYFGKFEDVGQSRAGDDVPERRRLLAALARDLDEYEALADEIADACDRIAAAAPSEWAERARSEITTAGYRPNRKHGVAINVAPLADAEIVPRTVDDSVL
ncbi:MAG: BREX-5 system adenine-specific DNA-methyltransferase PglX [Haloferacaceae archaeon]